MGSVEEEYNRLKKEVDDLEERKKKKDEIEKLKRRKAELIREIQGPSALGRVVGAIGSMGDRI